MKSRVPWTGLLLIFGAVLLLNHPEPEARAQLNLFGGDDPDGGADGGDGGAAASGWQQYIRPRKVLSNPWKADAGVGFDSGPGIEGAFKRFQSSGTGGGFLRERAPSIADITDSDASFFGSSDGGSGFSFSSFSLPSFGADIDAGPIDAGPVHAPVIRVMRSKREVTPLTTPGVPDGTCWARVPDAAQPALREKIGTNPGYLTLSRSVRESLWTILEKQPRWNLGGPGYVVTNTGGLTPVRLAALGFRKDEHGVPWIYGAYTTSRDGRQPVDPLVVLAASANIGWKAKPTPYRPELNVRFERGLKATAQKMPLPVGVKGALSIRRVDAVVIRTKDGRRVETMIHAQRRDSLDWCFDLLLDAQGNFLRKNPWSPICDPSPRAVVDLESDGIDEVIWEVGARRVLKRYPGGEVLDEDPPSSLALTPGG